MSFYGIRTFRLSEWKEAHVVIHTHSPHKCTNEVRYKISSCYKHTNENQNNTYASHNTAHALASVRMSSVRTLLTNFILEFAHMRWTQPIYIRWTRWVSRFGSSSKIKFKNDKQFFLVKSIAGFSYKNIIIQRKFNSDIFLLSKL